MTRSAEIQEGAKELAKEHWKWFEESVDRFAYSTGEYGYVELMEHLEWMFLNAFIHGYKHGTENKDCKECIMK